MPPKKRSRTVSAPPAPSTPEKKTLTATSGAATPKHANTEGKPSKSKTPRREEEAASSPAPHGTLSPKGNHSSKRVEKEQMGGGSNSKPKKERSKSLSVEGKSLLLSVSGSASPVDREKRKSHHSPIRPMKLTDLADDFAVHRNDEGKSEGASRAMTTFLPTNTVKDLESVVLRSKVIAPDISGIRCVAANRDESEVVVARENGSLVLYSVEYFQNIPHFTQVRSTGGRVRRTITRIAFLNLSSLVDAASSSTTTSSSVDVKSMRDRYFAASYLSGQIVLYDSETLFPVSVYQRTGGAVWDFTVVDGTTIYAALADGSWHRLRVVLSRATQQQQPQPRLELERIIPRITGADRAFSVTASSPALGVVVGTDDAGNVHAWRHASTKGSDEGTAATVASAATASGNLSAHETLWTCRLPKGMAMCCAIASGSLEGAASNGIGEPTAAAAAASRPAVVRPVVAVGTSMGDVIILDLKHGHILHTFATHKGPVSTVVCDQNVFYASGWHESLRAFRCTAGDGEWYPAEVKRRTHYHETSELLVLPQRQLMLSASRDGTLMFAPLAQLFSAPAVYVNVTTQRFAYAQEKNVLLQTRLGRIEAFRMDASLRHWAPLFAHNVHGKFHLNGLWCDPQLHYVVFSTDERVVVSRIGWREGAESALAISRIEEVLELPAGRGLVDAVFVAPSGSSVGAADADVEEQDATAAAAASSSSSLSEGALYLLFDDCVLYVTLVDGFPVIRTELKTGCDGAAGISIRPVKLVCRPASAVPEGGRPNSRDEAKTAPDAAETRHAVLVAFGLRGLWYCEVTADGTPSSATARLVAGPTATYTHVAAVPSLALGAEGWDVGRGGGDASLPPQPLVVGLSAADGRYVKDIVSAAIHGGGTGRGEADTTAALFPKSLPHDVTFVATMPRAAAASAAQAKDHEEKKTESAVAAASSSSTAAATVAKNYIGFFSKGLVFAGRREWRMAARLSVEAVFVMQDRHHLLVLERNLEKTLEALPLCWKVRRFGN